VSLLLGKTLAPHVHVQAYCRVVIVVVIGGGAIEAAGFSPCPRDVPFLLRMRCACLYCGCSCC
jgi:hypothetical protein